MNRDNENNSVGISDFRSNCSQMFKICVLKYFGILKGSTRVLSLFNKVAGLKARNFIKKRLQPRHFPANIAKLRTSFSQNTSGRLLL